MEHHAQRVFYEYVIKVLEHLVLRINDQSPLDAVALLRGVERFMAPQISK